MAKQKIHVEVGRRTVELSNLDKVLFPEDGIVKAEVIQYYLTLAPTILSHIKNRPLSLVRFPDGIDGEQFFQKNRPGWAPDWVDYIRLGSERQKEYVVATEDAALVWLANLACLEIHQMHSTKMHPDKPDYFVYDLDPPETFSFEELKQIAFDLKAFLEQFGYHVFVKSTGGKGLHLVTPLEVKYSFDEPFSCAKKLMASFMDTHPNTTLILNKEARKGRVLIDIYRNRTSQTIVSPYSIRGRVGATTSTPITWEFLEKLKSPKELNMSTTLELVKGHGDAWEGIRSFATPLHTDRRSVNVRNLPSNPRHKTPEQLAEYERKRDFGRTPEPTALADEIAGNRFVVQRHHATNLHYDLRLEQDGLLKSWAIPRGLPPLPGIKRLAVQTEDHPMKYLTFEGEIPKKEYGGGTMWVFANGRYEITKEKKNGFYFRLSGSSLNGEYRMHLMKDKEWLLERVDTPQQNWLSGFTEPMLAESRQNPPKGDFIYELKWDGIRCIVVLNEGELTVYSRNGNDITDKFPELKVSEGAFRVNNGIFDGEIVCLDAKGRADFKKVIRRLMSKGSAGSDSIAKRNPAYCYLFDCLYVDGKSLIKDPMMRRRAWLEDSLKDGTNYRLSELVEDGEALFEATKALGVEGIMAKDIHSQYFPGKRSDDWIKVKVKHSSDCLIVGYTSTESDRKAYFGALQLAEKTEDGLIYRGRVGTGFDSRMLKDLRKRMDQLGVGEKPFTEEAHEETKTTWVNSGLVCEVEYSMITDNGTFRDPVFRKLISDIQ